MLLRSWMSPQLPMCKAGSKESGRRQQLLTTCNRVSHSVTSDSVTPWTVASQAPLSMDFSIPEWKNNGVTCQSLLQRIFPTQGLNPHPLHCRQILYHWASWEMCVCWLLVAQTCVLLTHSLSQKSLSTLTVPCRMPFPGEQDENKMLPDLKKPQGSVRYRWKLQSMPQMISFNSGKTCNLKFTSLTTSISNPKRWCC